MISRRLAWFLSAPACLLGLGILPEAATADAPLAVVAKARPAQTEITPNADLTDGLTPELTPQLATLRTQLRRALGTYYPKHLNTRDNSPWEVMHGIISYGVDAQLFRNGPGGEKVNAISWMCYNGLCEGERLLSTINGKLVARRGPGLQGHYGQFLAILAQSHLKSDYPLIVQGKNFTLQDLIDEEMKDCEAGTELTFKLIALMHYLDSDQTWTSSTGETWSIQRLIKEELKQPIRGAACGGTHRLMGLSYAVNKRIKRDKPIVGEYGRAQKFIQDYHRYTFSLQNRDGSFSTEWFNRRADSGDTDRKLKTTGHISEWLNFSLTDEELRDPRMIKAMEFLTGILNQSPNHKWEIGPLGHALHALVLYDTRVFKPHDAKSTAPTAEQPALETVQKPSSPSIPDLSDYEIATDKDSAVAEQPVADDLATPVTNPAEKKSYADEPDDGTPRVALPLLPSTDTDTTKDAEDDAESESNDADTVDSEESEEDSPNETPVEETGPKFLLP